MPESHEMTRVRAARRRLVLDKPWYGALSIRLDLIEDPEVVTACTDGTNLKFAPEFTATLTDPQSLTLVAHEVWHCALGHPWRMQKLVDGGLSWQQANVGADYVVNEQLEKDGFEPLPGWLRDTQYDGLSLEQVCARLPKEEEGEEGGTPGPGDVEAPAKPKPGDGPQGMTESDWQIAVQEATNTAKKFGHAPAGIDRLLAEAQRPNVDNKALFRQFVQASIPSDFTWAKPDRRYLPLGMYLPGMLKENTLPMGVCLDASGSMGPREFGIAQGWFQEIMDEIKPEWLEVVSVDTEVAGVERFYPGDKVVLHPKGGGGTAFQPGLDYFSQCEDRPACVIYVTDLEGPTPTEPDYPVLWATTPGCNYPAPFGQLVRLD